LNGNGQLGNNARENSATAVLVTGAGGTGSLSGVKSIAPGNLHTCAVVNTGARCWGHNGYGALGDGMYGESLFPVEVLEQGGTALSGVSAVVTTYQSSCAIVGTARAAVCWGDNGNGLLGNGGSSSSPTPVPVVDLSNIESLSANDNHICARLTGDRLSCWGYNGYGQLGNSSSYNSSSVPVEVWDAWYR
jgi:alpha-tubulin suppressor-like RCC1 family protein